jgi:hypothetical protein
MRIILTKPTRKITIMNELKMENQWICIMQARQAKGIDTKEEKKLPVARDQLHPARDV